MDLASNATIWEHPASLYQLGVSTAGVPTFLGYALVLLGNKPEARNARKIGMILLAFGLVVMASQMFISIWVHTGMMSLPAALVGALLALFGYILVLRRIKADKKSYPVILAIGILIMMWQIAIRLFELRTGAV